MHYAKILADLAHEKGFKVLVATKGIDALELAKQFQPSAVSLDVFLPDMLGWTVLSQLKQNPLTRHIPVQVVTADEDRQHALARGAFSFINKPTTSGGVEDAIERIKDYSAQKRRRLLIVEDNPSEQLSIAELLGHDDIEVETVGTGEHALEAMRSNPVDCLVLDLKLPDMSGFEVLERMRADAALADVPVVVFTGRELSAREDATLHKMARSIVVKGVESPERLLDETSLFLHRVVTDLPPEKQRMLERLNSSDEDLIGRTVLLVDDDARNIFALCSVLERRGMNVLTATTGREAIELLEATIERRHRADGHHDAGDGWLSDDRGDPAEPGIPPSADRGADSESDEGRSREMSRCRRIGLSRQTRQHRTAACGAAHVAAPVERTRMTEGDKVNILLVDDQPGKLLSYEAILGPLGEKLITARSGREALECLLRTEVAVILLDVNMPELDGFELAAMIREHPRYRKIAMIFISAIHLSDIDRLRGYEMGAVDYVPVPVVPEVLRAKVRIFAELYRKTRQLEQLNSELEQRVRERTAELEAQTQRLMESEQRRSLALAAAQMGSWHWDSVSDKYHWDAGLYRIFGVDAGLQTDAVNIRPLLQPEDWPKFDEVMHKLLSGIGETHHIEFRIRRADGKVRWCIGSAASTLNEATGAIQISGVILDISERKADEDRQALLAREVDHRAKNALALVQALVRLTRAQSMEEFVARWRGESCRCRACIRSCRSRAGRARISPACCAMNWRRSISPTTRGSRSKALT